MTHTSGTQAGSNVVALPLRRDQSSHYSDRQAPPGIAPAHQDIQAALLRARARGVQSAVLVYRISGYRELVETFGEEVGAQLLISVQDQLRRCLRHDDTLRQLADDEFVVVPARLARRKDLTVLADRLLNKEGVEHALGELSPWVKAAVGIAVHDQYAEPVAELIRCARIAFRGAAEKSTARHAFYSKDLMQRQQYSFSLEADLRLALARSKAAWISMYADAISCGAWLSEE
jgi:diguanylate cyclase (GGDEF)-like protein